MSKVVFNLSEEQFARLDRLAKRLGVSRVEALRQSIELYQINRKIQPLPIPRR